MFPGQNRRVNDFSVAEKLDTMSRRHWIPPELPITSSPLLSLYNPTMDSFPNTFPARAPILGSLESWYAQRPALQQQAPLAAIQEQYGPLRTPLYTHQPRIPCDLRSNGDGGSGDVFQSTNRQFLPYSAFDSMPLVNTGTPFHTVPTSITITPSKQNKTSNTAINNQNGSNGPPASYTNGTGHLNPSQVSYTGPFANPPTHPQLLPFMNHELSPVTSSKPAMSPSLLQAQKHCAEFLLHHNLCRQDDCPWGDLCANIKSFHKHIVECPLKEQCPYPFCYSVRSMLVHYQNCRNSKCLWCCQINKFIFEQKQQKIKQEATTGAGGNSSLTTTFQNSSLTATTLSASGTRPLSMSGCVNDQSFRGLLESDLRNEYLLNSQDDQFSRFYRQHQLYNLHQHQNRGGRRMLIDPMENRFDSNLGSGVMVPNPSYDSYILKKGALADGDLESSTNQKQEICASPSVTSHSFQLGTSLFETFTPKAIEEYLRAVRGLSINGYSPRKPDVIDKDKICAVCVKGEQTLQPIQIYCDCCFAKIKRGGTYWKPKPETKLQICACHKCFTSKKSENFNVGQIALSKSSFRSCKNDECVTETWVACDKCGYWVHSSCGMFNRGENNEKAKYMCPFCLKEEMDHGLRAIPQEMPVSMRGAEQLPETSVSKFIQHRLKKRMDHEMEKLMMQSSDRCLHQSLQQSSLCVRVLMSIKKATHVQPMMASAFPSGPKEFPYRQRVIGVFQKIHGCDVLLFCMYVQEYGVDCPKPNQKWVNLEYIDSVKHFTPDCKTVHGESLRSVVYQEVLLAYIEFVKRNGFEVFYIWACPPSKEGEDYILHCKPQNQKIPSADRLRIWYKDLLKIAKEKKIVAHDSNLMDTFFTHGVDHIGAEAFCPTDMPYFEGDYWPTEAEKLLKSFQSTKPCEIKKKSLGKRKTRGEASLDEYLENGLMACLKFPRWSDFMVWHLHEPCSLCHQYITKGCKYAFNSENGKNYTHGFHHHGCHGGAGPIQGTEAVKKKVHFEGIKLGREGPISTSHFFQLCEDCYKMCHNVKEGDSIPESIRLEDLEKEEIQPSNTVISGRTDYDIRAEIDTFSEIFESRQSFLAFCKGNHYQFDTLQHAKHTTMMLLYHLHNAEAPVFPMICHCCGSELPMQEVKNFQGTELAICAQCRANGMLRKHQGAAQTQDQRIGGQGSHHHHHHIHRKGGTMAKQDMVLMQTKQFEAFQHAAQCSLAQCPQKECHYFKDIFRHVYKCEMGVARSCKYCRFFASFARRHASFCHGNCSVPNCVHFRAMAQQQLRFDQAQRRRGYTIENSMTSSSS